jgi:hypothetical protein
VVIGEGGGGIIVDVANELHVASLWRSQSPPSFTKGVLFQLAHQVYTLKIRVQIIYIGTSRGKYVFNTLIINFTYGMPYNEPNI